jgi:hypothetical protein
MNLRSSTAFLNDSSALLKSRLLPVTTTNCQAPVSCSKCMYVNRVTNNYCTNCGFPIIPDENCLSIYNKRLQQQLDFKSNCNLKISYARNTLYVLAACCAFGLTYFATGRREGVAKGMIMLTLSGLYLVLGRWTLKRPFTSLLISMLIMLTFIAITAWAEITTLYITSSGFYTIIIEVVLTYFIVRGVNAAFQADILEEELNYI